jgi:hypothetical protein
VGRLPSSSSLPPRGWGYGAWPEGPRAAALAHPSDVSAYAYMVRCSCAGVT